EPVRARLGAAAGVRRLAGQRPAGADDSWPLITDLGHQNSLEALPKPRFRPVFQRFLEVLAEPLTMTPNGRKKNCSVSWPVPPKRMAGRNLAWKPTTGTTRNGESPDQKNAGTRCRQIAYVALSENPR